MRITIDDNAVLKTSAGVVLKKIGDDRFVTWNRYAPYALSINGDTVKILKAMKTNRDPYRVFKGFKRALRKLLGANLLYNSITGEGTSPGKNDDPFKRKFFENGDRFMETIAQRLKRQGEEKKPYQTLSFFNHSCNLNCSYCIMAYATAHRKKNKPRLSKLEKKKRIKAVIDKVVKDRIPGDKQALQVMFNGGEFLLEWESMKFAVQYFEDQYPEIKTDFNVNTNGTLVTDEIAAFWKKKKFNLIGVSIDGYEETHNKTRVYHNGKGSYRDVLRGIDAINRHFPKPLEFFQGTLVPEHSLDVEKLMDMKTMNFKRARLGVNLLGISTGEARDMARLHFQMAIRSIEEGWSVMDDYFKTYASILGKPGRTPGFVFACQGLSRLAGDALYFNVETGEANLLCHYVTDCQVNLAHVENDIHHPDIFRKAENFLRKRYRTVKQHCADCEVVGACRGGCVIGGIDAFNRPNESACVFVKETWNRYLEYVFSVRRSRIKEHRKPLEPGVRHDLI